MTIIVSIHYSVYCEALLVARPDGNAPEEVEMADKRPSFGRIRQSRRRVEGARPFPGAADVLGRFPDALPLLSAAQNSLSAKEIPETSDEVVAIRYASDALKRIYNELGPPLRSPETST